MVSINVPPPQLWGGQHTEMFVDHVTVFSQSVSHIRLSHTILLDVSVCRRRLACAHNLRVYYVKSVADPGGRSRHPPPISFYCLCLYFSAFSIIILKNKAVQASRARDMRADNLGCPPPNEIPGSDHVNHNYCRVLVQTALLIETKRKIIHI